jgi:hypothetical protein
MTAVGQADIHKAVAALWASSGLNTAFQAFWSVADRSLHLSLNDGEASPACPFPYCVFSARMPNVLARMSPTTLSTANRQIHEHPWTFDVYAKAQSTKSAKEMAADMAAEILKVFGGHPTTEPDDLTLDNGWVLISQYQGDWGERQSDEVHKWTVEYNIRADVPVMFLEES